LRILYIFPHPDDESFGPAAAISHQRRGGHEVYLLTLTRGGATRRRFELGLTVEQMGEVRLAEMRHVAKVLDLSGMTVLDLPDGGLKELDPRDIERAIEEEIERVHPDILVTYPVHGISGFHDHLVVHGIVKRVYVERAGGNGSGLKRLAFFTQSASNPWLSKSMHNIKGSTAEEIDCTERVDEADVEVMERALECYKTYQEIIEGSHVVEITGCDLHFEIFLEQHDPPLGDLTAGLEERMKAEG
jgi:LmbE family N-acetylglucosaminyl deacetylase